MQVENVFISFSKIFLSKGIITLNVSLRDPPELIHLHLSEMPIYSPVFYLCDRVFSLTLLLHDRDYYHQVRIIRYLGRQLNSAEFKLLQSGLNILSRNINPKENAIKNGFRRQKEYSLPVGKI